MTPSLVELKGRHKAFVCPHRGGLKAAFDRLHGGAALDGGVFRREISEVAIVPGQGVDGAGVAAEVRLAEGEEVGERGSVGR